MQQQTHGSSSIPVNHDLFDHRACLGCAKYPVSNLNSLTLGLIMVASCLIPPPVCGQMSGGVGSSMSTPHEVKPTELAAGPLRGDVDLFTGKYNASYPLGSVSTPGGLSFSLDLNYSPTVVGGSIPNLVNGLPYGEGWDLNIPTITVHNVQHFNVSPNEQNSLWTQTCENPDAFQMGNADDGKMYWYDVVVNIPGVASGRAVFKRFEQNSAVFVMNTFEEPLELRFSGSVWRAYTSDGRIYEFGTARSLYTMPSNQRCMDYEALNKYVLDPFGTTAGLQRQKLLNSITPKGYTTTWYCSQINDPIHLPGESILFSYKAAGKFEFYKEVHQPAMYEVLGYEGMGLTPEEFIALDNQPVTFPHYDTWQEIWLQGLMASTTQCTTEEIELVYDDKPLSGSGMIVPSQTANDHDDLYIKEPLYTADQFTGWTRFPHIKIALPANNDVNFGDDPYTNSEGYHYPEPISGTSNALSFSHGFLASPVIPTIDLHSGDLIEVRTTVSRQNTQDPLQVGYFDINLTTNNYTAGQSMYSGSIINSQDFSNRHRETLFSTFDRAVKWSTAGDGLGNPLVQTSNFFMMPNLRHKGDQTVGETFDVNTGFTIEVGPANSDNNFSSDATSPDEQDNMYLDPSHASAYGSYAHARWLKRTGGTPSPCGTYSTNIGGSVQDGLFSHQAIPHSFGIGLPWSMMLNAHKYLLRTFAGGPFLDVNNTIDPNASSGFHFWWNHQPEATGYSWPNDPTLLGDGVKLEKVEIIRYSRKPHLLSRVNKYSYSGEYESVHATGARRLVAQLIVDHQRHERPMETPMVDFNLYPIEQTTVNRSNSFLLTDIVQVPVDASAEQPAAPNMAQKGEWPTTWFTYADPMSFMEHPFDACDAGITPPGVAFALKGGLFLNGIIDPLGATTHIVYKDPSDPDTSVQQWLDGIILLGPDNRRDAGTSDPCDDYIVYTNSVPATAMITPIVEEIRRSNENGPEGSVTSYDYQDPVAHISLLGGPDLNVVGNYKDLGNKTSFSRGFSTVTVLGPSSLDNERARSVYHFHGAGFHTNNVPWLPSEGDNDFIDYLCFGKLKKVQEFGTGIHPVRETETIYGFQKAYENGDDRPFDGSIANEWYWHDYFDYRDGFALDGIVNTSGSNTLMDHGEFLERHSADSELEWSPAQRNSYFVKRTREIEREWDNEGCILIDDTPLPWVEPDPVDPRPNPGGTGHVNGTTTANESYLKNQLSAHGLSQAVKTDILAASPVCENVLYEAMKSTTTAQVANLVEVLRAQPALTDDRCVQFIQMPSSYPTSAVLEVLVHQPYLSDAVLMEVLSNSRFTAGERSKLFLRQAYLSTDVIDELLKTPDLLDSWDLGTLLTKGPDLTFDELITLVTEPTVPSRTKVELLTHQENLGSQVWSAMLSDTSAFPISALERVMVNAKHDPGDDFMKDMLDIYGSAPVPLLRNMILALDRMPGQDLRTAIRENEPLANSLRGSLEDWEDLTASCGQPCASTRMALERITDLTYYEADHKGVATGDAYKSLFGMDLPSIQLKWEPSWLLFSKKVWSPQLPGVNTTDEYFYYADLRNRYDRMPELLDPSTHSPYAITFDYEEHHGVDVAPVYCEFSEDHSFQLPDLDYFQRTLEFRLRTADAYQHRTRFVKPDEAESIRNEFFEYRANWNEQPATLTTSCLLGTGAPCENAPLFPDVPNPNVYPPVNGCWQVFDVNYENEQAFCMQVPPGYTLVHSDPANDDEPWLYFVVPTPTSVAEGTAWGLGSLFLSVCDVVEEDSDLGSTEECPGVHVVLTHTTRMPPFSGLLRKAFQLFRTDVQADEHLAKEFEQQRWFSGAQPLMEFHHILNSEPQTMVDEPERWAAFLPYPTIMRQKVHERNAFQQPQVVENERGLKTKVEYDVKRYRQHIDLVNPCNDYFSVILDHPGLPSSITQGVTWMEDQLLASNGHWEPLWNALTTHYSYNPDNSVASITSPNNMVTSYTYDSRSRLKTTTVNGQERVAYTYQQWHLPTNTAPETYAFDYDALCLQNYVETRTRNKATDNTGVQSRAYVDPLGRAYNTITRAVSDVNNTGNATSFVSSGRTSYDNWGRVIRSYKPYQYQPGGNPFPFALTTAIYDGTPALHSDTRYEMDQRDRPLFTTPPGIDINAVDHLHNTRFRYRLLDHKAFACHLGLSAGEAHLLAPQDFEDTYWRMSETEDADGNVSRAYANALGQNVATQGMLGNGTGAVTLFIYDAQGNLALTINPEKQWTSCKYNLLGQLYQKETVDDGITKYMYDRSGNVVLEQDATLRAGELHQALNINVPFYRLHKYDLFNRRTEQSRVTVTQEVTINYDPMVYETVRVGLSLNDEVLDETWDPQPWTNFGHVEAWRHEFSTASTQFEMDSVHLFHPKYTQSDGYGPVFENVSIQDLLIDTLKEKEWHYDRLPLSDHYNHIPANTLYGDIQTDLDQLRSTASLRGRVSHTITWPHRTYNEFYNPFTKVYGVPEQQEAVLYDFFSYNNDGQVNWQVQQFNANRISAAAPGLVVRMEYPFYDLRGNLLSEKVDVNADHQLDMHYTYLHDGLGRLEHIRASHDADPTDLEELVSYTYDDALGRIIHTDYTRTCGGGGGGTGNSFTVDHVTNTFDTRDRLTSLTGRFHTEQLLYEGTNPTWQGNALAAGNHWNGLINGTVNTYTPQEAVNATAVAERFSQPTAYGYTYDGLGRLTQADGVQGDLVDGEPFGSPVYQVGDERYDFDRIGNLLGLQRQVMPLNDVETHAWDYVYAPTRNRLIHAEQALGSTAETRLYTYDRNGNVTGDSYRNLKKTVYGRANLPFFFHIATAANQKLEDMDEGRYLYDAADSRIFKYVDRKSKEAVDLYEFYLHDVAGREIGIMDLQGDLANEHRCTWSWFLFGNQRHLRIEPLSAQQPYLFDADWSQREMADQTNSEYSHVRQLLLAAYSPLHGVSYPVSFVHMDTTGVDLWLTALQYDSLLLAEPELQAAAEWYTFTSPKDQVSLRRSNAERDEVLISAGELLNEGLQRGAGGQASAQPFTYTEFSDTHLNKVYFYAYDHLGNTRVTYSQDCKNWNNVEPSDEDDVNIEYAADYYPYGKVLREFVNERAEKYLTTLHQRDEETGLDYRGARYYDSDVARFLSLDPLAKDYVAWSPYNYVLGNPITFTDPTGRSASGDVTKNEDGTYTLQNAKADGDLNIYVVDESGKRTGEVVGMMMTNYSFLNDDLSPEKGAIIDPRDQSGNNFFQKEIVDADPSLAKYMANAYGGEPLDFKARGLAEGATGEQLMHHIARGMPFDAAKSFSKDGTRLQTYASARDIGNFAAGYMASTNGANWIDARKAFDGLESIQQMWPATEAMPSVASELRGFLHGLLP